MSRATLLHEGAFLLGPRQWTRLAVAQVGEERSAFSLCMHRTPSFPLIRPADDPVEHLGSKLGSLES